MTLFLKKILSQQYYIDEPFPKRQILDSSKLKEFADDNFKFDENFIKFSERVEDIVGKKSNYSLRAISLFSTVFFERILLKIRENQGLFRKG